MVEPKTIRTSAEVHVEDIKKGGLSNHFLVNGENSDVDIIKLKECEERGSWGEGGGVKEEGIETRTGEHGEYTKEARTELGSREEIEGAKWDSGKEVVIKWMRKDLRKEGNEKRWCSTFKNGEIERGEGEIGVIKMVKEGEEKESRSSVPTTGSWESEEGETGMGKEKGKEGEEKESRSSVRTGGSWEREVGAMKENSKKGEERESRSSTRTGGSWETDEIVRRVRKKKSNSGGQENGRAAEMEFPRKGVRKSEGKKEGEGWSSWDDEDDDDDEQEKKGKMMLRRGVRCRLPRPVTQILYVNPATVSISDDLPIPEESTKEGNFPEFMRQMYTALLHDAAYARRHNRCCGSHESDALQRGHEQSDTESKGTRTGKGRWYKCWC